MLNDTITVHGFGDTGVTNLNYFVLLILFISFFIIINAKNHRIILFLFIYFGLIIPMGQKIIIFSLDFTFFRLMIIIILLKFIINPIERKIEFNKIDKFMIYFVVLNAIAYILCWKAFGAIINRLGFVFDTLGIYFIIRYLVNDLDDIFYVIRLFLFVSMLVSFFMIIEQITGRNYFSIFGGVSEFTVIREGRLRSQGPFAHPILAGTYGATVFPLIFSVLSYRKKSFYIIFIVSLIVMIITSASSTPVLTLLAGILAIFFWLLRNKMSLIRKGIILGLILLDMIMKAPVWFLIARVSAVGGSTSYHRASLIDQFIRRFKEWFLFGVKSTYHWGYFLFDTANQYVDIGVTGGFFSFLFFILILIYCYKFLGNSMKLTENKKYKFMIWAIGASLFSHMIGFIGITYFDQTIIYWYSLIAIISSLPILLQKHQLKVLKQ